VQSDLEPRDTGSGPREAVRAALLDGASLVRALGSGRRRGEEAPAYQRVELRYVDLKAGRHLQVTAYDATQAHTANHAVGDEARGAVDELLDEPFGNWHVETTTQTHQVRVTKKLQALVHTRPRQAVVEAGRDHDREPLKVEGRHTGFEIDLGFFSRLRPVNRESSFSVLG
jgi:hypothetical protein